MFISILLFPFLGAALSGFLGRKLGITGSQIICCSSLFLSAVLSSISFYDIYFNLEYSYPVWITLGSWIESELLNVSWEFSFDQLSIVFCIMITYITFLILIYTVYYLDGGPHNQRFFSYMTSFAGFMLVLVTGGNYFVMFVGWEGILKCFKWFNNDSSLFYMGIENIELYSYSFLYLIKGSSFFINKKIKRVGPHNIDIISLIIGSTLGNTHLEKRKGGLGTRVVFEQSNKNVEYLMWFHKYLYTRGYCNPNKPKLQIRIRKNNERTFQYRISSYTFFSFNWIHDMFYIIKEDKLVKIVPTNIKDYLTPLALAIWFMNDGSKSNNTIRIATNSFSYEENLFLCYVLKEKYNINASVQSSGKNKGFILYISTKSVVDFIRIVKPYMLPSMYYKLGNYQFHSKNS